MSVLSGMDAFSSSQTTAHVVNGPRGKSGTPPETVRFRSVVVDVGEWFSYEGKAFVDDDYGVSVACEVGVGPSATGFSETSLLEASTGATHRFLPSTLEDGRWASATSDVELILFPGQIPARTDSGSWLRGVDPVNLPLVAFDSGETVVVPPLTVGECVVLAVVVRDTGDYGTLLNVGGVTLDVTSPSWFRVNGDGYSYNSFGKMPDGMFIVIATVTPDAVSWSVTGDDGTRFFGVPMTVPDTGRVPVSVGAGTALFDVAEIATFKAGRDIYALTSLYCWLYRVNV